MLRNPHVLYVFTCKCAFRRSGEHCFDIRTSKSAPNPTCFVHVHLQMCFALQRRVIFRHQNFKKCSEPDMFCTFSLANVLRATAACNFSTSERQKVLRTGHVLYIFTCKCAFRHSGEQFFDIRTSKSAPNPTCFVHFHLQMRFSPQGRAIFDFSAEHLYLRTRRFNRPTFRLTRHTNH